MIFTEVDCVVNFTYLLPSICILFYLYSISSHITKFMGPTWGPPGSHRPRLSPSWPQEHFYQGIALVKDWKYHHTFLAANWQLISPSAFHLQIPCAIVTPTGFLWAISRYPRLSHVIHAWPYTVSSCSVDPPKYIWGKLDSIDTFYKYPSAPNQIARNHSHKYHIKSPTGF